MKVWINGETQVVGEGMSLEELLRSLKLRKEAVVCELNRSVVGKDRYGATYLNDNDSLEIVHFVGGG